MTSLKLNKIFKIILIIIIPINILFLIIFYNGNLRYNLTRIVAEGGNIITEKRLFRAIENRNFLQGVDLLNKQLNRTQKLSPGNNTLLKSLFKNIKYSFNSTVSIEDKDYFESFLKRMVEKYPDTYSLRVWYAQTLQNNDPDEVYKQLDSAIKIISSDPQAYRIGIRNAFINQDDEKLKFYCNAYHKNQLGGIKYGEMSWNFYGIGLRALLLELNENNNKIFIRHNGLSISKSKKYEFLIPNNINIENSIKLHLATADGIKLTLNGLVFYSEGNKTYEYSEKKLSFSTENSYVDDDGSILLSFKEKPEIIEVFIDNFNEKINADKIILDLSFEKLNMSSLNICQ